MDLFRKEDEQCEKVADLLVWPTRLSSTLIEIDKMNKKIYKIWQCCSLYNSIQIRINDGYYGRLILIDVLYLLYDFYYINQNIWSIRNRVYS